MNIIPVMPSSVNYISDSLSYDCLLLAGRMRKLVVYYLPAYFLFLKLYPFTPSEVAIFTWRAIASQIYMCPAKPDINI